MASPVLERRVGREIEIVRDAPATSVVRIRDTCSAVLKALSEESGLAWPHATNHRFSGSADSDICCVGPREWIIVGVSHDAVHRHVAASCAGVLFHVSDVSAAWSRWRVRGAAALDVLAKGCSLDLEQLRSDEGRCARTLVGQIGVLLYCRGGEWRLHAERALAPHVSAWFQRAAAELEITEVGAH